MEHFVSYEILVYVGAFCGLAAYCSSCVWRGKTPEVGFIIESGFWGALVVAGAHLMLCCLDPSGLVHFLDANGDNFDLPNGVVVKIDVFHGLHLIGGGAATIFLSLRTLYDKCHS